MRVYISGPITGLPEGQYHSAFQEAEEKLKAAGYETLNPAYANSRMPEWYTHDDFMKICRLELLNCDMIYQLPGWEESEGCNIEAIWAKELNIKVLEEI